MLRALPMLEPRRRSLELCVYCPKLCRAACPVSNATGREAHIPTSKMMTAYLAARGDVEPTLDEAATAYACTGCYACRERCDHRNEPGATLLEARAAFAHKGLTPGAARATIEKHEARQIEATRAADELSRDCVDASPRGAPVLIGCTYLRKLAPEARDAVSAAAGVLGERVRPVGQCCGLPLLQAGDVEGFSRAARALVSSLGGARTLVVVDPGCAVAIKRGYAHALGDDAQVPEVVTLVELAHQNLARLTTLSGIDGPVRYHDPCQLGRGLGLFAEPRAVLAHVLGRPADEFELHHEKAACSGGGGLLPATMPEASAAIARARLDAHRDRGGGMLVTACASSLRRFRSAGAEATDLVSLIARARRA